MIASRLSNPGAGSVRTACQLKPLLRATRRISVTVVMASDR